MPLIRWNGTLLRRYGQLASSLECCCLPEAGCCRIFADNTPVGGTVTTTRAITEASVRVHAHEFYDIWSPPPYPGWYPGLRQILGDTWVDLTYSGEESWSCKGSQYHDYSVWIGSIEVGTAIFEVKVGFLLKSPVDLEGTHVHYGIFPGGYCLFTTRCRIVDCTDWFEPRYDNSKPYENMGAQPVFYNGLDSTITTRFGKPSEDCYDASEGPDTEHLILRNVQLQLNKSQGEIDLTPQDCD